MLKLFLIFLVVIVAPALGGPSDPEPRPDQWWIDRHNQHKLITETNPGIPIIFYGDSITEGWGGSPIFQNIFAPRGVVNYGIGGDQVQHVLWRIMNGEVQGLNPKLVVLKIGTNNLGGATAREIADGVGVILAQLKARLPNTQILLLSVLPRPGEAIYTTVAQINIHLSKYHDGVTVWYQNIFDHFGDNWGTVSSEWFSDGVHLTQAGYQHWYNVMFPWFYALCGCSPP